jgi:hypothetical protein
MFERQYRERRFVGQWRRFPAGSLGKWNVKTRIGRASFLTCRSPDPRAERDFVRT